MINKIVDQVEFGLFGDVLEMVNVKVPGDVLSCSVVDCVGAGVVVLDGFAEVVVEVVEGRHFVSVIGVLVGNDREVSSDLLKKVNLKRGYVVGLREEKWAGGKFTKILCMVLTAQ